VATILVIIYAANWVFADLLNFAMMAMRDFPTLSQ
jgi:type III secretory pathway component EscS